MLRASLVVDHKLREYVCSIENIKSKKAHTGRLEHTDLSKEKIENSLLNLMLGDGAFPPALKMTQVQLQPGPMADLCRAEAWAYFPVDALIGLVPVHSAATAVALVGRHGCIVLPDAAASVQAHVVSPGRAYRRDWVGVNEDPDRFAPWLWHAAAAAQSLIGQMAQWSFCAQHHSPSQQLASWLLYGLAQSPKTELTLSLAGLPPGIQTWLSTSAEPAVSDSCGFVVDEGCLRTRRNPQLAAQACSCHTRMAHPNFAP